MGLKPIGIAFALETLFEKLNIAPEQWDSDIDHETRVRGLFRYVGVAPLPYRYDLVPGWKTHC